MKPSIRHRAAEHRADRKAAIRRAGFASLLAVLLVLIPGSITHSQQPAPPPAPEPEPEAAQATPPGLARGKKLVLADGTFHLVRSYERQGDRVRFYSVERSAWEEIPAALVDWEATRQAEEEETARQEEVRERLREVRAAELALSLDVDASLELAPGLFLPEGHGLFVFEQGQVRAMEQTLAEVKLDKKRVLTQILVPVPVVPTRHRIEVQGRQAGFRVRTPTPEFYMRTADQREPEMELVRAKVTRRTRQLEFISTHLGQVQWSDRETIAIHRWEVARGVYRLTPSESLTPGEYALIELVPGEGTNLYVWDFGVDPPTARPRRE